MLGTNDLETKFDIIENINCNIILYCSIGVILNEVRLV